MVTLLKAMVLMCLHGHQSERESGPAKHALLHSMSGADAYHEMQLLVIC